MAPPGLDKEDADDLAEQLADLRRGDEVAIAAEGVARLVIAVFGIGEAQREIVGDADRAGGADDRLDLLGKWRGHRTASALAAARRARQIAQSPISTIGRESSMPMVSQPPKR